MKTMESSKKRCNEWFYIYCELSKRPTRAASTQGCSRDMCAVAARGRRHPMTYSCVWSGEKPFHVYVWNGERKSCGAADRRQYLCPNGTGVWMPTTLTPKLVQELRHTQRKPVSGRKPLRRLLPIPSEGIAHVRGTVASSLDPYCFESWQRLIQLINQSCVCKINCHGVIMNTSF